MAGRAIVFCCNNGMWVVGLRCLAVIGCGFQGCGVWWLYWCVGGRAVVFGGSNGMWVLGL